MDTTFKVLEENPKVSFTGEGMSNVSQGYPQAVTDSGCLRDHCTGLGVCKLWHPKKSFQVFFFQLYFNKKYLEVVINDFTMHLSILKWLRKQKIQTEEKNKTKKKKQKVEVEAKEDTVNGSVSIYLNM